MSLKKKLQPLALFVSTGMGLGLMPWAPGTWGSLLGIPLGLFLLHLSSPIAIGICLVLLIIFAYLAEIAGEYWNEIDAKQTVSDEVLGQAIALLGIRYVAPHVSWSFNGWNFETPSLGVIVASFVLFRLFDILKPFPANTFDRSMKNGWGVVLDDVAAGIYAALSLYLILKVLMNHPA